MIAKTAGTQSLKRALSVGGGIGEKEMKLLSAGVVEFFDLYEITPLRIEMGIEYALKAGLSHRLTFHAADAFAECTRSDYDLVYWNNSLHHMLDTDRTRIVKSERLASGGIFAMDDFVGPSRFQWTDRNLEYASNFRKLLPEAYLYHPDDRSQMILTEITRPSMKRYDTDGPKRGCGQLSNSAVVAPPSAAGSGHPDRRQYLLARVQRYIGQLYGD